MGGLFVILAKNPAAPEQILQSSTYVEAEYNIISSSGTSLMTWTETDTLSSITLYPPYENVGVSDELSGLESEGYAQIESGTDFQIESVIHPDTATDFTGHYVLSFSSSTGTQFSITSCSPTFTSFVDEEGVGPGATGSSPYTYGTAGAVSSSNEYYQYIEVT